MSNTLFVIGAGASKEANLPTGNDLKEEISNLLDMRFDDWGDKLKSGDYKIVEALRLHTIQDGNRRGNINPYLHEAWHIRDAMPQAMSIDNFLDTQRSNEKIALCGKLGIVRSILNAEKESLLYFEKKDLKSNIDFSALSNTWYIPFFQLLTENCSRDDLKKRFKLISLIIFNYDRCIEHFLFNALQNYYRIPENEAAELVSTINIYHPYGDVGMLPFKGGNINYGLEPNARQLLELSGKIKTFTEGTDQDSSEILLIRKIMSNTSRLIFLGFAFHKLNMQLITPSNSKKNVHINCYSTTKGMSDSDKDVVKRQIKKLYEGFVTVNTTNSACGPFFNEFRRSLGF